MAKLEGTQQSFWKMTGEESTYPKLTKDIEVDVAVIGGGISGVLTAYLLAKEGKSVALIEALEVANGTTGGTTAKVSSQHQLIYAEMLAREGVEVARQFYEANEAGLKLIESLVEEYDIECDFRMMDSYVYSQDGNNTASLEKEAKAYEEIGIDGGMVDSVPLDFDVASALVMRKQAQFHPVKFIQGMVKEFEALGGKTFEQTRYMESEKKKGKLVISTDTDHKVTCKQAVLATLFPMEDPHNFYVDNLKPVSSHLTAFKSDKSLNKGMYISEDSPKRTFRGAQNGRQYLLIVGGHTHPTGDEHSTIDRYESIRQFAKDEFGLTEMIGYWSEHDMVSPDRRPFIGPIEEGDEQLFVMTGYSKWGLTAAAIGAKLITDLIDKKDNVYEQLFSPERDLPSEDDEESEVQSVAELAAELKVGEAKRFEELGEALGMYKDQDETIHYLDLACTHLGCEVAWNDGDETWDCPCHGSVFEGSGDVIAGPAKEPLKKVDPY